MGALLASIIAVVLAVGACTGSPSASASPSPATTPTASPTAVASSPAASPTSAPSASQPAPTPTAVADESCLKSMTGMPHQAREIEALLPTTVAGRKLTVWSVRGRCWLIMAGIPSTVIDELLASVDQAADPPFDLDHLTHGIAGRSDTKNDPPYFVFAAARTYNADEIDIATFLMFGGAMFKGASAALNLALYDEQTIAGHDVWVGTEDMLEQSTHQRGRPYLYQTETTMFLVITDDEAWAADAIRQLP
jgi:hypothetical protein